MAEMTQWTILTVVLSLFSTLHGQEPQAPTLQTCCQNGRDAALRGQDCTILPPIAHSHTCSIAQEQCCTAEKIAKLCDHGVEFARNQGVCERPFFKGKGWETQISKTCCDCCMLGLSALDRNKNCDLQELFLGDRCEHTAKTCCSQNTTEVRPKPEDSVCAQLSKNGTCGCHDGYQLKSDGVNCQDINECLTGGHDCVSGQTCINTQGSFRCQRQSSCGTGYELRDNNKCEDIDECTLGTHDCGPQFTCTNTAGSFRCHPKETCSTGFIQDAAGSCMDINECVANDSPCHAGHTCINTRGSYICRRNIVYCGRGYHLRENGTHCEDIDECRTGSVCVGHGCTNLLGSYRCECRAGFTFNSISRMCQDVNECRGHRLCAHRCENTEGSYRCSCSVGFKLSSDGRSCEDVNECEQNPCNQECVNVYGSYQCYCRRGYQLSDIDGVTCKDIDECALPAGGHVCSYSCSNTPGSFVCTCPPIGYILSPNGRTCQDVDECAAENHNCSGSESCFNVQGGFRCLSFQCPENFQQVTQGRCDRVTCEFTQDPASCLSLPLRISFYNISFPSNTPVPTDIFRMGPSNSIPGDEMLLNITSGNEEGVFVVHRQLHGGVISLQHVLSEPRDYFLTVEMRLIRYRTVHLYMAKIAVFVTQEQPVRPSFFVR
ncbi:fibulin-1 [Cynoglossus semilaevis]|uniref:Fibulin-1 n=1 Tax=Cynoglossus semilaevis TaxID=244447 RepID=A0A3P8VUY4_CYNSE|nr:fibulin-1 [Cynoglossus semilaevis]